MLFILLLFFLVSPFRVFAAPVVSVIDFPESIIAGNTFNVTFSISTATPDLIYHYKIVGDGNSEILTQPNTSCASSYDTCESIKIASSSSNIATASAKLNLVSGIYNLKIRIAQNDKHTSTYNSDIVTVTSILPTSIPTPIPTSTPFPTNTPTMAPTLTPTSLPTTKPTITPTVSLDQHISPTGGLSSVVLESIQQTDSPTEEPPTNTIIPTSGSVLGQETSKENIIPLMFICLGAIFLLAPLIIAKIKPSL